MKSEISFGPLDITNLYHLIDKWYETQDNWLGAFCHINLVTLKSSGGGENFYKLITQDYFLQNNDASIVVCAPEKHCCNDGRNRFLFPGVKGLTRSVEHLASR